MLLRIEYSSGTKLELAYSSQKDPSKSKVQLYVDTGMNLPLVRPTIMPLGAFIDSLKISSRDQYSPFVCNESASIIGSDSLHEAVIGSRDILADCIKLKELTLYQYRLVESNGEARVSSPIEILFLNYCQYSPSALLELSYHLTNLKYLTLNETNTHSFENFECSHLFIDMSYTSFDTFDFGHSLSFSWYTYIYVKLSTIHGEKYVKCVKGDSHQATAQEYEKGIINQLILTLELKCKKIRRLQAYYLNEPEHVTYMYDLNQ